MARKQTHSVSLSFVLKLCVAAMLCLRSAGAYSVLSHEEVVDMAWKDKIVPMLQSRFPGISEDEIRQAHAYAYGGSVIQDIGYYPFGSHYFSDLLHYVRPDEFVDALIRDSTTPDEYAFALGALAHYCGDIIGHPVVNQVTSAQNPRLNSRFGQIVTYFEDPTAHVRTEFGFDVVEVAQGHYSQQNYRDFIGFQVSKSLMNQAFQETYGIPVSSVLKHEDLAIGSYRRAVSALIPRITTLAFVTYKDKIQQAAPGVDQRKFLYRLDRTEYEKDFGNQYQHVGIWGHIIAFLLKLAPKVGPFKALQISLPNPQQQDLYLKSINATVDRFHLYLGEIHAAPAPLPPPEQKDAAAAQKAADKISKAADKVTKAADSATDPEQKAKLEADAAHLDKKSDQADAAADRTQAKVDAAEAGETISAPHALPQGTPIKPPSVPKLLTLDLDTGRPSSTGEYTLADRTYAHLLHDLAKARRSRNAVPATPGVAAAIATFFAHPVPPTSPPHGHFAHEKAERDAQVQADLATLSAH
jgi:hypothetical protein